MDQLHRHLVPGHRSRLQQAERTPDGAGATRHPGHLCSRQASWPGWPSWGSNGCDDRPGSSPGAGRPMARPWPGRWCSALSSWLSCSGRSRVRDDIRSAFSLDVFDDRTFLIATGISIAVVYLGTTLSAFQAFLDTVPLDLNQWLVCIGSAATVLVVTELRKFVGPRATVAETSGPLVTYTIADHTAGLGRRSPGRPHSPFCLVFAT